MDTNTINAPQLIEVKQINGRISKINPWHIVKVDQHPSADGFERIYSIVMVNSQILDISPLDVENYAIMNVIDPYSGRKVV